MLPTRGLPRRTVGQRPQSRRRGSARSPIPARQWAFGRDDHAPDAPSALRPGPDRLLLQGEFGRGTTVHAFTLLLLPMALSGGASVPSVATKVPPLYRPIELNAERFLANFSRTPSRRSSQTTPSTGLGEEGEEGRDVVVAVRQPFPVPTFPVLH